MKIDKYSIAAHLVHSRMQLIRHRLSFEENIHPGNLVHQYKDFFYAASASILAQHGVSAEYRDIFDAAKLLLLSFYPPPSRRSVSYYVVQKLNYELNKWFDIQWYDKENGLTLADPKERMSEDEAKEKLKLVGGEGMVSFRIREKFAEPD